jgi:hypothetical protein
MFESIPFLVSALVCLYIVAASLFELVNREGGRQSLGPPFLDSKFWLWQWKVAAVAVTTLLAGAIAVAQLGQGAPTLFLVHLGFGGAYLVLLVACAWALRAGYCSESAREPSHRNKLAPLLIAKKYSRSDPATE